MKEELNLTTSDCILAEDIREIKTVFDHDEIDDGILKDQTFVLMWYGFDKLRRLIKIQKVPATGAIQFLLPKLSPNNQNARKAVKTLIGLTVAG